MSDQPITPATYNGNIIYRSTPLTVEGPETVRLGAGGDKIDRWKVRLVDGTVGTCWTALGEPCPFEKGKNRWYTREDKPYGPKLMPYDAKAASDKDRMIARMNAVDSAAALGASLDNWKEYAEAIYNWTYEQA